MRINKFVALATGISRRDADTMIAKAAVKVNGQPASAGQNVSSEDAVTLSGRPILLPQTTTTIMFHKPPGYVVSRDGQGSPTIYDLLPPELHNLKPVGRLDKDSSGLLLLTNDGQLAQSLTHPSYKKQKLYEITLDKPLEKPDFLAITKTGIDIGDNQPSRFWLVASGKHQVASKPLPQTPCYFLPAICYWQATLAEGRNRQIRRTFAALNYQVTKLHRTHFGTYQLGQLRAGQSKKV